MLLSSTAALLSLSSSILTVTADLTSAKTTVAFPPLYNQMHWIWSAPTRSSQKLLKSFCLHMKKNLLLTTVRRRLAKVGAPMSLIMSSGGNASPRTASAMNGRRSGLDSIRSLLMTLKKISASFACWKIIPAYRFLSFSSTPKRILCYRILESALTSAANLARKHFSLTITYQGSFFDGIGYIGKSNVVWNIEKEHHAHLLS